MGTRGPAPERESQRRRRNKPPQPVEHVDGAVPPPELGLPNAHPLAVDMYEALKASPEAAFMTPAAWQRARVSAHALSETLQWRDVQGRKGMSSTMYAALQQDWKALLIDPAELRRLQIEVRRAPETDPDAEAAVAHLADFRARTS